MGKKTMITSFSIQNFKSYNKAEMKLSTLSLFIGANASGKSNALEAIRLLSWLAQGSHLDDLEGSIPGSEGLLRGQPLNLFRNEEKSFNIGCDIQTSQNKGIKLSIEIGIINDHLSITNESVYRESESLPLYSVTSDPSGFTDEISVIYNNFKKGGIKPKIPCSNRQAIFYQLETPARFAKSHEKSQKVIPAVVKEIRESLRNIVFLDPKPTKMRDYSYAKDNKMKEDGTNLSGVLYGLCDKGPKNKSQLLEFVRFLPEQDIVDIKFIETDRNDVMLQLIESFGNVSREVDAPMLSDGTLRVLAVGATLLSSPPKSLVVVEEIDNGVHPSRAKSLIQYIREIAEERQLRVLLTSHNPALLDALPDESLPDVLCCYRDQDEGSSQIARLGQLDRYPELVAQGPLGQLMTKRVLDRFIKDKTTPKEQEAASLSWLKKFKKGVYE